MNNVNRPTEFKRKCKQTGCNNWFRVSKGSMDEDKLQGLSAPEYCPEHSKLHAKSYSRIAVHHIEIQETEYGSNLIRKMDEAKDRGEKIVPGPGGIGYIYRDIRPFEESTNPEFTERDFPIAKVDSEILQALEHHQVLVLVGPTGSGKSTHVPHMLLRSKWSRRGPIVITQPRIQATQQIPRFIAKLNNSNYGPGCEIGYSHSKADAYDRRTRLLFMTDGKLINDIVSGAISNYSIIMIDEAHERSVNIDLILALLKDQLYLYPHLRLIIASATIDEDSFVNFFGGKKSVPVIKSEGRFFKVTNHWWADPNEEWWKKVNEGNKPERDELPNAIADLVEYLLTTTPGASPDGIQPADGHILAFLPGTREIDITVSAINARHLPNVLCLPLYASRPLDEQDRALDPKNDKEKALRRVVVSTNVAETSLTVEGVKFVIDSGYIKESIWNSKSEVTELRTVPHSKAGCKQRWGRAGRTAEGDSYMLYTQQQYEESFPDYTPPNIVRASMEQVVLTALAAGVRDIVNFEWMPLSDEKDKKFFQLEIRRAISKLSERNAVRIDENGIVFLTEFGLELRGVPTSMDVAAVFADGDRHAMGIEVATLLPFLKLEFGLQSILRWDNEWDTYRKLDVRQKHLALIFGCQDDLDVYLKLWTIWETLETETGQEIWCEEVGVDCKTFRERIVEERKKLIGTVMDWHKAEKRPIIFEKIDALRALIASTMHKEIYIANQEDCSIEELGFIDAESYFENTDYYEEYEEGFDIDLSIAQKDQTNSHAETFHRLNSSNAMVRDEDLIEIAPISICYSLQNIDLIVVCQRRANYLRPARAKILGINIVRVQSNWLPDLQGDIITRAMLLASLSRLRSPNIHHLIRLRLFTPWILPPGSEVKTTVQNWDPSKGCQVTVQIPSDKRFFVSETEKNIEIKGFIASSYFRDFKEHEPLPGEKILCQVIDYESNNNESTINLAIASPQERAYKEFIKRFSKSKSIDVVMHRVLKDPLERSPIFIVREPQTGLEIPMADADFSGGTHFRSYFGLRFKIGDLFRVDIVEIAQETQQIFLSRINYLIDEYAKVPREFDRKIKDVRIDRIDPSGIFVKIEGTPYISFVRKTLLPNTQHFRQGDSIKGRIRFYERNINIEKIRENIVMGFALSTELDFGIEIDVRIPPAFYKFTKVYSIGQIFPSATVDRPLDNGSLLIDLEDGLKGLVYESELDLSEEGKLKRARDYLPGDPISVRITNLKEDTARIECSLFRKQVLPLEIKEGDILEARVLLIRPDYRNDNVRHITCCLHDKYRLDVYCDNLATQIVIGQQIKIQVTKKNIVTQDLRGTLIANQEINNG